MELYGYNDDLAEKCSNGNDSQHTSLKLALLVAN